MLFPWGKGEGTVVRRAWTVRGESCLAAQGGFGSFAYKQVVAFFDDSGKYCALRSKFNGRIRCFSWRLYCRRHYIFLSRGTKVGSPPFGEGEWALEKLRLLREQLQSLTQSQASVMALESPHVHRRYAKWLLKSFYLGNEGRDPPSIFKGPEAFRTREHCWHIVTFLIWKSHEPKEQKDKRSPWVPGAVTGPRHSADAACFTRL